MKKKIIYSLIILVVAVVSVYGFSYYKNKLENSSIHPHSGFIPSSNSIEKFMWIKSPGAPSYSGGCACGCCPSTEPKPKKCLTIIQYLTNKNKPNQNKDIDCSMLGCQMPPDAHKICY